MTYRRHLTSLSLGLAPVLFVALAALGGVPDADTLAGIQDISSQAWKLAYDGRLADLWQRIESLPADTHDQPQVASLRRDLENHLSHEEARRRQVRQAYDNAMAKLGEELEADRLSKALTHANEAHSLADDPDAFLQLPEIKSLMRRAASEAQSAEDAGRWFEALLLYRRLELMDESKTDYKQPRERVSTKLRMLRSYNPDAYYAQQAEYARAQGEDPPGRWEGDEDDSWQAEFKGIDSKMLLDALDRAATRHIESATYERLFAGGVDSLTVLIHLEPLTAAFPALADADKVARFDQHLAKLRAEINRRTDWMTYSDANLRLRELLEANRDTVGLPEPVIIHEFAEGAMDTLDEYSDMIWPVDKQRFERTTRQEFSGVGIQITLADDELTVVSPLEGTPAHRARLKAGDRIVTIDAKATSGISLDQAVNAITGPEGTTVTLGIRSAGSDDTRSVTLTRKTIKIDSVNGFQRRPGGQWDYYVDPLSRIGYLRVSQFGPDTAVELDKAVKQMNREGGINGLVLDLRFNPGGLLKAAVDVSNRFISHGTIVSALAGGAALQADGSATLDGGAIAPGRAAATEEWVAKADARDTWPDFPVVVLINRGSASASEIVAGCLQDHRRALIVGDNSFGKGSVQQLFGLKWNSAYVKITTQYYVLPSGRIIHRRPGAAAWGVKPDVEVHMSESQVEKLIKARMVADVLRDDDSEQVDIESVIGHEDEEDEPAEDAQPLPTTAREVLDRGYDPQLETAVLLLKARILSDIVSG